MKDSNHECIEATAGGTTKGGLESADIWGDADDVSLFNHSKIELTNYCCVAHERDQRFD